MLKCPSYTKGSNVPVLQKRVLQFYVQETQIIQEFHSNAKNVCYGVHHEPKGQMFSSLNLTVDSYDLLNRVENSIFQK